MKLALLPLAAALLAQPAPAQPGPGVAGAAPKQPGPGIAEAPAVRKTPAPPVYDEAADAKADVAAAVAKAKKEKKRVLVTLGANWCGWCRALDRLFTKDETVAAQLAAGYVPVKVDVGRMTKNLELAATWGADPKTGVPLLVVLDGNGKAVKVQETGSLESGKRHDPEKVIAFLKANAGV
ncbi:MAG: thioredoxin family protein [Thermoanaerobaculia bacterium]|nr:thioredoxin family protein [Thermoanaerobaculia bacterium]